MKGSPISPPTIPASDANWDPTVTMDKDLITQLQTHRHRDSSHSSHRAHPAPGGVLQWHRSYEALSTQAGLPLTEGGHATHDADSQCTWAGTLILGAQWGSIKHQWLKFSVHTCRDSDSRHMHKASSSASDSNSQRMCTGTLILCACTWKLWFLARMKSHQVQMTLILCTHTREDSNS